MSACVVHNNAKASLPLHRHADARVIVVLDGEVQENDLSGRRVYRKGEFLFRPPFCAHANAPSGAPSAYLRLTASKRAWLALVRRHGWRAMRGVFDFEDKDHRSMLRLKNGGDDLLGLLAPQANGDDGAKASQYASLGALAAADDLKPYELTRRFQRRFGLTPSAWRREWRVRRALSLLASDGDALASIAADCGFADQSHFSREVKTATGLTPAAFRAFIQS